MQPLLSSYPALPQQGILYFFYEDDLPPIVAFNHGHNIPWLARVLYHSGDLDSLVRTAPPDITLSEKPYQSCRIEWELDLTLPDFESHFAEKQLGISWDNFQEPVAQSYLNFLTECQGYGNTTVHRFMGHPDPVQGGVFRATERELALKSGGTPFYDGPEFAEWMLMLQVDSEDAAKMMWGDVGRLYFCIKRSDWETRQFDRMICEMECS
jgi:hypothetical protein